MTYTSSQKKVPYGKPCIALCGGLNVKGDNARARQLHVDERLKYHLFK